MTHKQMLRASLYTLILSTIGRIASHHLLNNAWDDAKQHPLVLDLMDAFGDQYNSTTGATNSTAGTQFNLTMPDNSTSLITFNETNSPFNVTAESENLLHSHHDFYWKVLPSDLLVIALLCPFVYSWHIWLERMFPTRPRPRTAFKQEEKTPALGEGETDLREEEIIQKYLAQGKIRRASLSWWNTSLKWILNLTIGYVLEVAVEQFINDLLFSRKNIPLYSLSGALWTLPIIWISVFFSIAPLITFVGFIVAPAHRRMVFGAGAEALWWTLVGVFLRSFLPWLGSTEFMATFVGNFTQSMRNATRAADPTLGHLPALSDEL